MNFDELMKYIDENSEEHYENLIAENKRKLAEIRDAKEKDAELLVYSGK